MRCCGVRDRTLYAANVILATGGCVHDVMIKDGNVIRRGDRFLAWVCDALYVQMSIFLN